MGSRAVVSGRPRQHWGGTQDRMESIAASRSWTRQSGGVLGVTLGIKAPASRNKAENLS